MRFHDIVAGSLACCVLVVCAWQNYGQGLGFVMMGRVIDRNTLAIWGVKLASSLVTVYAILMAMADDSQAGAGGPDVSAVACELSAQQAAGIMIAMLGHNESCAYNMTVQAAVALGAAAGAGGF
eukprot:SAG22_NODE_3380_length_1746_cov_1.154827_2_plen_124_part_00